MEKTGIILMKTTRNTLFGNVKYITTIKYPDGTYIDKEVRYKEYLKVQLGDNG